MKNFRQQRALSVKEAQKRTVRAKRESAVRTYDAASQRCGGHWTIPIKPRGTAFIAETLRPCHLVSQNHGPGHILLVAENGDLMDLPSGNLRATYVHGSVRVEVRDDQSALIELEFLPVFLKN
jgi:hypothetical protein